MQELDLIASEYGSDFFSEKYQNFPEVITVKRPIIITWGNFRTLLNLKFVGKKRYVKLPDSKWKGNAYGVMLLIMESD
jgi:hypothetical protein